MHVAILVVLTILRQSRRDPGIPGLGIRQSRIPGLKIQVDPGLQSLVAAMAYCRAAWNADAM